MNPKKDNPIKNVLGNPVLVGTFATLFALVACVVAYNAMHKIPFVPVYEITVVLPDAAEIVVGNDVRIAGDRVGQVQKVEAVADKETGQTEAKMLLEIASDQGPLSQDTTVEVRAQSLLGEKYVELFRGKSTQMIPDGGTIPLSQSIPSIDIDQLTQTFNPTARAALQDLIVGMSNAVASRGGDMNAAIQELNPLMRNIEPVMNVFAESQLGPFIRSSTQVMNILAPVGGVNADLVSAADTTFTALAFVASDIRETLAVAPGAETSITADLPPLRPFMANTADLAREFQPAARFLPTVAPPVAEAMEAGVAYLPRAPAFNRRLASTFRVLEEFSKDGNVPLAIDKLDATLQDTEPITTFITPAQTTCEYGTFLFKNLASVTSNGDTNGYWARLLPLIPPSGTNAEGFPSNGPANGPEPDNYLHANPYPSTAAPGQGGTCAAGHESYAFGQQVIGNPSSLVSGSSAGAGKAGFKRDRELIERASKGLDRLLVPSEEALKAVDEAIEAESRARASAKRSRARRGAKTKAVRDDGGAAARKTAAASDEFSLTPQVGGIE